jgi:hypothetical protein
MVFIPSTAAKTDTLVRRMFFLRLSVTRLCHKIISETYGKWNVAFDKYAMLNVKNVCLFLKVV